MNGTMTDKRTPVFAVECKTGVQSNLDACSTVQQGCDTSHSRRTDWARGKDFPAMTIRSKPCRYGCGQDVVFAMMPSGHWLTFSIEPVPYSAINPDLPAVVWKRDGCALDAHTAARTPRLAYPIHLCPAYREQRLHVTSLAELLPELAFTVTSGADAPDAGQAVG